MVLQEFQGFCMLGSVVGCLPLLYLMHICNNMEILRNFRIFLLVFLSSVYNR